MKTMGLTDLRLVAPARLPAKEDEWMATHAGDVLRDAKVVATLGEAVSDCVAAFALSARPREWSPQVTDIRAAAGKARALGDKVAFVFGNESAGLTNEEMFVCQHLVHIPANPGFTSLNLAQAVQVVAYELYVASGPADFRQREDKLATVEDIEGLYGHLEEAGIRSGFHVPESGSKLPERLRRLFSRVPGMTREEVNILRGLLKALLAGWPGK